MKAQIHPKWFDATVTCACGNTFTVGASVPAISVEICAVCHPFYTGQMKYIDTAGRVEAFKARQAQASKTHVSKSVRRAIKRTKKVEEERSRPDSLAQLRKEVTKKTA